MITAVNSALPSRHTSPVVPRRVPSAWRVMLAQFRMIDASRRFTLLLAALASGAVVPLMVYGAVVPEFILPFISVVIASVVWPVLVWRGEGPRARMYHRILPVNHVTHDLLKVAAGAAWLFVGMAIILLGMIMSVLLSDWPGVIAHLSPSFFVSYFSSALLVYLLVSIVPILTNRPLEWMFGISVGYAGLNMLDATYNVGVMRWLSRTVFEGPFGFMHAFYGAYSDQPWRVILPTQVYASSPYDRTEWLFSILIWLPLAIGLVWLASYIGNRRQCGG